MAEGRAPEADSEVVIDRQSAKDGDLAVGDTITDPHARHPVEASSSASPPSATPTAWAAPPTPPSPPRSPSARCWPSRARSRASWCAGDGGEPVGAGRPDLRRPARRRPRRSPAAALTREQEDDIEADFLGMLQTFLTVFAGIALVVATFSIYNTFSILVAQRTRESALLRALGASRRQVVTSVVAEALVVGFVASAHRHPRRRRPGPGPADASPSRPSASWRCRSWSRPRRSSPACWSGLVVTVAASVAPALRASRVAPLAALRDVAIDRSASSRWRAGRRGGRAGRRRRRRAGRFGRPLGPAGGVGRRRHAGRLHPARPDRGPAGGRRARRPAGPAAGHERQARPPERHAQPPPHGQHRLGADGGRRRGHAVHGVRRLHQAVGRRHGRGAVRRRPGHRPQRLQRRRASPRSWPATSPSCPRSTPPRPSPPPPSRWTARATRRRRPTWPPPSTCSTSTRSTGRCGTWAPASWPSARTTPPTTGTGWATRSPVTFADGVTDDLVLGATYARATLLGDVIVPTEVWLPHAAQPTDDVVADRPGRRGHRRPGAGRHPAARRRVRGTRGHGPRRVRRRRGRRGRPDAGHGRTSCSSWPWSSP